MVLPHEYGRVRLDRIGGLQSAMIEGWWVSKLVVRAQGQLLARRVGVRPRTIGSVDMADKVAFTPPPPPRSYQ